MYKQMCKDAYVRGDLWFIKEMIEAFGDKVPGKNISRLTVLKRFYEYKIENEKKVKDPTYKPKKISRPLDIDRAKQYPITDIYQLQSLRRHGNKYMASCPFHSEKTGSFFIYIDTNSYYCFGCGKGGDSIKFYMDLFGCDFKEAVRRLGG